MLLLLIVKIICIERYLTFDLLTSISIGVIYWSCHKSLTTLRTVNTSVLKLSIEQTSCVKGHYDLDLPSFTTMDQEINGQTVICKAIYRMGSN